MSHVRPPLAGLLLVAAPAAARSRDLADMLAGRPARPPINCISLDTNTSPASTGHAASFMPTTR